MSAILILVPEIRKVSPSTTQRLPPPRWQIEKRALGDTWALAGDPGAVTITAIPSAMMHADLTADLGGTSLLPSI